MEALIDIAYLRVSAAQSDDEMNRPGHTEALADIEYLRVNTPRPDEK